MFLSCRYNGAYHLSQLNCKKAISTIISIICLGSKSSGGLSAKLLAFKPNLLTGLSVPDCRYLSKIRLRAEARGYPETVT